MIDLYANFALAALLATQIFAFFLLIILKKFFSNLSEKTIIIIAASTNILSITLNIFLTFLVIINDQHHYIADLGTWFGSGEEKYEFRFVIDVLAVSYALFSSVMIGLITVFSRRYLHKEKGYFRFYTFMMLFLLGVNLISFAGAMEIVIAGWEFVGISSVILIAFFNYREMPVKNALRVFINYRICDIGIFAAILLMHSTLHSSDFAQLTSAKWFGIPAQNAPIILGFMILFGALGKSALFPFSNWLPRAMEGPTPSSAIFYGAISIHFGPLLLLRSADLIASSPLLTATIILIGIITAVLGTLLARAQSDVKSMFAYEAVAQIGIIATEIGCGFYTIAVIHIISHSCYRTAQILRAPSLIHDLRNIEQMLGHPINQDAPAKTYSKKDFWKYRAILERGYLNNIIRDYFLRFLLWPFYQFDRLERRFGELFIKK